MSACDVEPELAGREGPSEACRMASVDQTRSALMTAPHDHRGTVGRLNCFPPYRKKSRALPVFGSKVRDAMLWSLRWNLTCHPIALPSPFCFRNVSHSRVEREKGFASSRRKPLF